MTKRVEITANLKRLLELKVNSKAGYLAEEVAIDWGTKNVKYVDYMHCLPANTISISGIERSVFTCYEIKSCYEDVYSGNGLNFIGDKNYLVMTMDTYKKIQPDILSGKIQEHIKKVNPESVVNFGRALGILVAVPYDKRTIDEYENPTAFENVNLADWELDVASPSYNVNRKRSALEMMFFMMKARGH